MVACLALLGSGGCGSASGTSPQRSCSGRTRCARYRSEPARRPLKPDRRSIDRIDTCGALATALLSSPILKKPIADSRIRSRNSRCLVVRPPPCGYLTPMTYRGDQDLTVRDITHPTSVVVAMAEKCITLGYGHESQIVQMLHCRSEPNVKLFANELDSAPIADGMV